MVIRVHIDAGAAKPARVGGNAVYAQRIISRPGKKDGLYWPAQSGADESPLGDLAASAAAEGYRAGQQRAPYHGYYYKVLTKQGPNAAGGALNYVVRGKMIGGFALVAYPAEYRNSGVMTFLVNHQGDVYEKDLGPGESGEGIIMRRGGLRGSRRPRRRSCVGGAVNPCRGLCGRGCARCA
jgi:Protein of unknown function (DUF2950)